MLTERLNRRNKAGLFVTLLATAASLITGSTWSKSLGVALLGLALTWLIGATRTIHFCWVASLVGLLLASGRVGWRYQLDRNTYYHLCTESGTAEYVARDSKTGQNIYWDEIRQQWVRLDQKSGNLEFSEPQALIPGAMSYSQFAAWVKKRYPPLAQFGDEEVVEGVLARRKDLHFHMVNGEEVIEGESKRWELLARPASLHVALREEWALTSVGMAVFFGGLVGVWLVRRHTITRPRTVTA